MIYYSLRKDIRCVNKKSGQTKQNKNTITHK